MNDELDDKSIEHRQYLEKVAAAYHAFIDSVGHGHWVRSREHEISITKGQILANDPLDRKDEIESFKLRGELRAEESFLTIFEDTVQHLDQQVRELLDRQQPTDDNK